MGCQSSTSNLALPSVKLSEQSRDRACNPPPTGDARSAILKKPAEFEQLPLPKSLNTYRRVHSRTSSMRVDTHRNTLSGQWQSNAKVDSADLQLGTTTLGTSDPAVGEIPQRLSESYSKHLPKIEIASSDRQKLDVTYFQLIRATAFPKVESQVELIEYIPETSPTKTQNMHLHPRGSTTSKRMSSQSIVGAACCTACNVPVSVSNFCGADRMPNMKMTATHCSGDPWVPVVQDRISA